MRLVKWGLGLLAGAALAVWVVTPAPVGRAVSTEEASAVWGACGQNAPPQTQLGCVQGWHFTCWFGSSGEVTVPFIAHVAPPMGFNTANTPCPCCGGTYLTVVAGTCTLSPALTSSYPLPVYGR
jgi:hypothetical protein